MRVAVVTPNPADSALAIGFLREEGISAEACASLAGAAALINPGVSCVVLVEEALVSPDVERFHQALSTQEAWSDMPLVLIAGEGRSLGTLIEHVFPLSGNVTVLQRPLHPVSLASAVTVALRSRQRQYQVRDLLAERDRALKQRDEFLAMLAHELRNPLAPIRNAVYLLGTLPITDPLFMRCRTMIDKQAKHITRMVDDLLDVSRLELGKVELRLQSVDLNDAIEAAAEACAPMTVPRQHKVTLRPSFSPLVVRADPVRLEQAIGNLIINAAKFTPQGGIITIEAAADGPWGVIRVTDNGVGIRSDMLESIFDLFAQSEVTLARTAGGLGIGLTLVKRLLKLHGGTITASSAGPGEGSRFEARLPLTMAPVDAAAPVQAAEAFSAPKRILIAEDGDDTRESLGLLVGTWHHEVLFAANGPDALRVARECRPDIALIDIGLPGCDGYCVARTIREDGTRWSRDVRLIALTGYGQASDRSRALEAGFDAHMLKPVDPAQLELALGTRH